MKKRTKIVATLGPSCDTEETIAAMITAGVNVFRLNFSHGTYEHHAMLIETIRKAEKKVGIHVAILQDLQGPKIRVGVLPEEGVLFEQGARIVFDTQATEYLSGVIPIDYHELHTFVKQGERLLLNDGKSEVVITHVDGTLITTEVRIGGLITSHKGINVPDSQVQVRALTDKDKQDAAFGVEHGVDFIALSFVTKPEDILDLRHHIASLEHAMAIAPSNPIHIIAKIERQEAVDHIDVLLDIVDGIMIARGDLGVEIPAEKVPLVQKRLIDAALAHAKPVIVATQMLDSMQHNPRPTRAEVSDVANAVIDHADAVMLSNETATGDFPVEVVTTMANIIIETETSHYAHLVLRKYPDSGATVDGTITQLAKILSEDIHATLILVASLSGMTGRLLSRHRPQLPIAVVTSDDRVARQLLLSWGVVSFLLPTCRSIEELVDRSMLVLKEQSYVVTGNRIVVVAGEPVGQAGAVNVLEVRDVV